MVDDDIDYETTVMVERRWVSASNRHWGIRDGQMFKDIGSLPEALAAAAEYFDAAGGEVHILPDTTDEERG